MGSAQERGWPEWRCAEPLEVVRIVAPHFVAGIVPFRGMVVSAAPILRYMIHWNGKQVADYCKRKGWKWEKITQRADASLDYPSDKLDPLPCQFCSGDLNTTGHRAECPTQ